MVDCLLRCMPLLRVLRLHLNGAELSRHALLAVLSALADPPPTSAGHMRLRELRLEFEDSLYNHDCSSGEQAGWFDDCVRDHGCVPADFDPDLLEDALQRAFDELAPAFASDLEKCTVRCERITDTMESYTERLQDRFDTSAHFSRLDLNHVWP